MIEKITLNTLESYLKLFGLLMCLWVIMYLSGCSSPNFFGEPNAIPTDAQIRKLVSLTKDVPAPTMTYRIRTLTTAYQLYAYESQSTTPGYDQFVVANAETGLRYWTGNHLRYLLERQSDSAEVVSVVNELLQLSGLKRPTLSDQFSTVMTLLDMVQHSQNRDFPVVANSWLDLTHFVSAYANSVGDSAESMSERRDSFIGLLVDIENAASEHIRGKVRPPSVRTFGDVSIVRMNLITSSLEIVELVVTFEKGLCVKSEVTELLRMPGWTRGASL